MSTSTLLPGDLVFYKPAIVIPAEAGIQSNSICAKRSQYHMTFENNWYDENVPRQFRLPVQIQYLINIKSAHRAKFKYWIPASAGMTRD